MRAALGWSMLSSLLRKYLMVWMSSGLCFSSAVSIETRSVDCTQDISYKTIFLRTYSSNRRRLNVLLSYPLDENLPHSPEERP